MNKEFEFLKLISDIIPSDYIGDDCAYLDEYKIALSTDSLVEDVHFSRNYMTAYEIAQKSLIVNISDILASGAVPKYFSIGLSGNLTDSFVEEFYKGLNNTAKRYDVKLIGGDLTKSARIVVSITILGSYKNRRISSRKNAKDGYIVAVAGEFGTSAQGLYDLKNGIRDNYFIGIHKKPKLYPEISSKIALNCKNQYAMMDSSDGLFDCLYQISSKSNVRIDVDYYKIPHKTDIKDFVLYGGEDYCLVAVLHPDDYKKIDGLTTIGFASKGEGVFVDGICLEYQSFEHFN